MAIYFSTLLFTAKGLSLETFEGAPYIRDVVVSTKKISLEDFPGSYNPSIISFGNGYLLTFRYPPDPIHRVFISYIGVVLLDEKFEPISRPQLLNTRTLDCAVPSQSEDARLFSYRGRLFLIYNDNDSHVVKFHLNRRDMFIAELFQDGDKFILSTPLKLRYEKKYHHQLVQKNWVPFEWDNTLLLSYSIYPHEVIYPNLYDGMCYPCYESSSALQWDYGTLRGSTPPILIDGEYLAFFHSGLLFSSSASWDLPFWHYFMGAYTFAADPPFAITKMTPYPIVAEGFYTPSDCEKRVIFPGGVAVKDSNIYVAYGKDDCEVWVATIDMHALKKALVPCPKDANVQKTH